MIPWGNLFSRPYVRVCKISSMAVKRARFGIQAWKHRCSPFHFVDIFSKRRFSLHLTLFLKFVNFISLLSEMIYSCLILLTFSFSLADEICDRDRENCEDLSKVKRANFYSSTRSNIQDVNISSTVTLNDGVKIPIFGLGVYLTGSGQDTRNAVLWAMENGYRQIDTAARYMNEESVGEAVRESKIPREDIFVVTKLYDTDHGFEETLSAFKKSLGKLGMEYVDLYLMHSPVPDKVVPSWNAMVKLQQEGLIRSIGVSNFGIHHLEELKKHSTVIPSVNQIEVHPFLQENDLVNYCKKEGIAIQAYSPMTRGEKLGHPTLKSIAEKHSKSSAQILLRWCIQKDYICIPKSSQPTRIVENASIFDFNLPEEDIDILDGLEEGFRTGKPKILQPWNG